MRQSHARSSTPSHRAWVSVALAAYVVTLGFIVFWPTPVDRDLDGTLFHVLAWLHAHGAPGFVNYAFVERTANILLFVPAGLLIALLLPRRLAWAAVLCCVAASVTIELGQGLLLPERFASIFDVAMNSFGGFVGVLLATASKRPQALST